MIFYFLIQIVVSQWFLNFEEELKSTLQASRRDLPSTSESIDRCYSPKNGMVSARVVTTKKLCENFEKSIIPLDACPILTPEDVCLILTPERCNLQIYPAIEDLKFINISDLPIENDNGLPIVFTSGKRLWLREICFQKSCLFISMDKVWFRKLLKKWCPSDSCELYDKLGAELISTNCRENSGEKNTMGTFLDKLEHYSENFVSSSSNSENLTCGNAEETPVITNEYYQKFCAEEPCKLKSVEKCEDTSSCLVCRDECHATSWCQVYNQKSEKNVRKSLILF
jgi:hypothetical protein